jgi:hypothetical protein
MPSRSSEPGDVTCILRNAADLAFHLAHEPELDDTIPSAPPPSGPAVSTRGNTLRMIPKAPASSGVTLKHDSGPSVEAIPPSSSAPPPASGIALTSSAAPSSAFVPDLAPVPEVAPGHPNAPLTLSAEEELVFQPKTRRLRTFAWLLVAVLVAANVAAAAWLVMHRGM